MHPPVLPGGRRSKGDKKYKDVKSAPRECSAMQPYVASDWQDVNVE